MDADVRNYLDGLKQEMKDMEIRLSHRIDGVERNMNKRFDEMNERFDATDDYHQKMQETLEVKYEALESRVTKLEAAS